MTNDKGTRRSLNYHGTHIAAPASGSEDHFIPFEASRKQLPYHRPNTRRRHARVTNPVNSHDAKAARGGSPARNTLPTTNVAAEDTSRYARIRGYTPTITAIDAVEGTRHNNPQAARLHAFSHVYPVDEETDATLGASEDSPLSTKDDLPPGNDCPTRRDFGSPRFTWFSGAIIFTCSVSTVLSGVFVALALKGQRYGGYIGNSPEAKMNISAAILWTSIIAKTIELSFATCVVTLLGQVVSRKAIIASRSQGASLSELTLWRWVVQPGSMITSFEIGRYAGLSALGVLTLLSTILSTVYMTAATTLVQPVAKQSDWHDKVMMGSVRGEFVHATHIGRICQTPLYDLYGSCVDVENTGRSFSNLAEFLGHWRSIVTPDHNMSTRQEHRPTWIGLAYNNTYVAPQWVDVIETAEVSGTYNRVINNVSLAFPHIGVSSSVYDQRNVMPLSDTSDSIQPYSLWASVPSPVMKVICVHMNQTELEPIIYDAWPNSRIVNSTTWLDLPGERDNATTVNKTVVDDLFGWTKEDKTTMLDYPPVFPRYPIPFSTVLNLTGWAWGRAAIYILGQGGPAQSGEGTLTGAYPLCKLEVDITPRCSTLHSVLVSGTLAKALCDDRASNMAYSETNANATTIRGVKSWGDVGARWANSLSLGTGTTYLQQVLMTLALEPKNPNPGSFQVSLNPRLPSLAETLAVMAADTILGSLYNSPFVDHWVSP